MTNPDSRKGDIVGEMAEMIHAVAEGNPGAMTVIRELMYFSKWSQMMYWCRATGFVGPKIWEKYKDEFHQDWHALGEWMQEEMRKDANKRDPRDLSIMRDGKKWTREAQERWHL